MASDLGAPVPLHHDVYDFISPHKLAGALNGKVAIITGASRGIGEAIALAFAEAGADVALLARTKSHLEAVASTIRSRFSRRAIALAVDVTDEKAVYDAVSSAEQALGPVDIVVPNAGISEMRPFAFTPMDDWWKIMGVNVKGQLLVAQAAYKSMRVRGKGMIIFNASETAVVDMAGMSAYCASKAAVVRAAGCIQLEADAEGKDIQVFSLNPGGVRTNATMGDQSVHPDTDIIMPGTTEKWKEIRNHVLVNTPELCAWSCVLLATGAAREIRGRYIDVRYDLGEILKQTDIVKEKNLHQLKVQFFG